ncbi:MAG: hypothetical protein ACHQF0_13800, partial [Chitinophagales bacterium]
MTIIRKYMDEKRMIVSFFVLLLLCITAQANIISYRRTGDGVSFTLDKGKMYIHIIGDDVVEVKYTNLSALPDKKSLVVLKPVSFKNS